MIDHAIDRLLQPLQGYVRKLVAENQPSQRLPQLQQAANFIVERLRGGRLAELVFVCTHNSRRSQFGQVWAAIAADFHRLGNVRCASGGVEVTACDQRTVRALRRVGLSVVKWQDGSNPVYLTQFADDVPPIPCMSKIYTDAHAETGFAAMMCCAEADQQCPVVEGAAIRVPLHYADPKEADDTPQEAACYDERCWQIACDMFQLMSLVVATGAVSRPIDED